MGILTKTAKNNKNGNLGKKEGFRKLNWGSLGVGTPPNKGLAGGATLG